MLYPSPIQLSHVYGPIAYRVLQDGPKSEWRNTSFGDYEPSTVSVLLSVVKCGRVCREQTYAHSGIEPSRLAKGFLQGGPRNSKKIEFLTICRRYVSQQPLNIEPYKQRTYLFDRPCTHCRNPVKPVPVKKLYRMRMTGLCQFYWRPSWNNSQFLNVSTLYTLISIQPLM